MQLSNLIKQASSSKRLLWLFLTAILPLVSHAVTTTIGQLKYELDETTHEATVTGLGTGTTAIHDLVIPESVDYNDVSYSVTKIWRYAFDDCTDLTGSLTIGDSVTTIGNGAFHGCSGFNGTLTIGKSVTTIGELAFRYCSGFTGSLTIPDSVIEIGNEAFNECSGFNGSLTISNSLTELNKYVFSKCSGLTGSLTFSDNLTKIGYGAFYKCSGLTGSLTIPDNVTEIGEFAFDYCSGLTGSLTIGKSISSIGKAAFYECTGITDVTSFAVIPPTLGEEENNASAFASILYQVPLYVPRESIESYQTAYEWKNFKNIEPIIIKAESIVLDKTEVTLKETETVQLSATVLPETTDDKSVTWKSSDENVATVDANGKVTAVTVGKATITATAASGVYATCEITVIESPENGVDEVSNKASVIGVRNGLAIRGGEGETLRIYAANGQETCRKVLTGEETLIALPKGVYIVVVGTAINKFIVK